MAIVLHNLGMRLRELREKKGLSQDSVAKAARVGRSTLVHLENGADVRLSNIVAVAKILEVAIEPVSEPSALSQRRQARFQNAFRMQSLQSAHRRIALDLLREKPSMRQALADARRMVELWEREQTCSPFYIETWKRVLSGALREAGEALSQLDESWEPALLQNTPFGPLIAKNNELRTA